MENYFSSDEDGRNFVRALSDALARGVFAGGDRQIIEGLRRAFAAEHAPDLSEALDLPTWAQFDLPAKSN